MTLTKINTPPCCCAASGTGYSGHGYPGLGAEDVAPDDENSGGPPFNMGLTMSVPKKVSIVFLFVTPYSSQPFYD